VRRLKKGEIDLRVSKLKCAQTTHPLFNRYSPHEGLNMLGNGNPKVDCGVSEHSPHRAIRKKSENLKTRRKSFVPNPSHITRVKAKRFSFRAVSHNRKTPIAPEHGSFSKNLEMEERISRNMRGRIFAVTGPKEAPGKTSGRFLSFSPLNPHISRRNLKKSRLKTRPARIKIIGHKEEPEGRLARRCLIE